MTPQYIALLAALAALPPPLQLQGAWRAHPCEVISAVLVSVDTGSAAGSAAGPAAGSAAAAGTGAGADDESEE